MLGHASKIEDKFYADGKAKVEDEAAKAASENRNISMSQGQVSEQLIVLKAKIESIECLFNEECSPDSGSVSHASCVSDVVESGQIWSLNGTEERSRYPLQSLHRKSPTSCFLTVLLQRVALDLLLLIKSNLLLSMVVLSRLSSRCSA